MTLRIFAAVFGVVLGIGAVLSWSERRRNDKEILKDSLGVYGANWGWSGRTLECPR